MHPVSLLMNYIKINRITGMEGVDRGQIGFLSPSKQNKVSVAFFFLAWEILTFLRYLFQCLTRSHLIPFIKQTNSEQQSCARYVSRETILLTSMGRLGVTWLSPFEEGKICCESCWRLTQLRIIWEERFKEDCPDEGGLRACLGRGGGN